MATVTDNSNTPHRVVLRFLQRVDRCFGRGSYNIVKRWLDPKIEYSQITYGRVLGDSLKPSCRWLEAGCGHELLKHGAGTEQFDFSSNLRSAIGCDLDMRSLKSQKLLSSRVCCDLGALPFRSQSVEIVTLNNVAEHLSDPIKVLFEISRVLRDDGRLIIHTPNARSYWVLIARISRLLLPERLVFGLIRFLEYRDDDDVFPTLYRLNTKKELTEAASRCGLRVEQLQLLRGRPIFHFLAPYVRSRCCWPV